MIDLSATTQHEFVVGYEKPQDSSQEPEPVLKKFTTDIKLSVTPQLQRNGKSIELKLSFSKKNLVLVKKDVNESGYKIELPVINTVAIDTNIVVAAGKNTLIPIGGLSSTGGIAGVKKPVQQTLLLVRPTVLDFASGQ